MKINLTTACACAAILFGIVFFFDYRRYVMPDAASTSLGTLMGIYLVAWLLFRAVKFKMHERAPQNNYFILVTAAVLTGLHLFTQLTRAAG